MSRYDPDTVQRVLPTAYSLQPSVFPCPLYLTHHRLYSAPLHRFLSADPLGPDGGINLYAYASGNPLAYVDPLGLCGQSLDLPDVSRYGILSVLAPATLTGSTAYEDHYSSYTLPMLQTIADGLATETAVANVQQGMVDSFAENALISTETDTVVAEEVAAEGRTAEQLVTWVDEGGDLRAGGNPGMRPNAYDFQSGVSGARSSALTGRSQAPYLSFTDEAGNVVGAKFDGVQGSELIDRKLNPFFSAKAVDEATRQAAVAQYYGLQAVWELPNPAAVSAANRFMQNYNINGIIVRLAQ